MATCCSCLCGKKEYGGTVETDITVFLCSCIASCQLKKISNKVKRDENSAEGAHEADNSTIDQDGMQDEGESHMSLLGIWFFVIQEACRGEGMYELGVVHLHMIIDCYVQVVAERWGWT